MARHTAAGRCPAAAGQRCWGRGRHCCACRTPRPRLPRPAPPPPHLRTPAPGPRRPASRPRRIAPLAPPRHPGPRPARDSNGWSTAKAGEQGWPAGPAASMQTRRAAADAVAAAPGVQTTPKPPSLLHCLTSMADRMGLPAVPPGSPSSLLRYCCPTCEWQQNPDRHPDVSSKCGVGRPWDQPKRALLFGS